MTGILEELAVCLVVSLGLRAISAVAQILSTPDKTSVPQRGPTCAHCADRGDSMSQVKTNQ
jgi:hypothetical protein